MAKRNPKTSITPSNVPGAPLDALLDELSEHGLNWVFGKPLWEQLTAHGYELIPAILERVDGDRPFTLADLALQKLLEATEPTMLGRAAYLLERSLARGVHLARRIAAVRAFQHGFTHDPRVHDQLLNIALDPGEEPAMRAAALQTLAEMKPAGAQAERLLGILDTGQDHWLAQDALRGAVFLCLRRHALQVSSRQLLLRLEPLLTHADPRIRTQTIELIGAFGDIDIIEHLFALPDAPAHRAEILDAVAAIAARPINLLSMRPDAFEAFIARVLKRMKYRDVKVTRYSGDGGIDAECTLESQRFAGDTNEKVIVQCKRYTRGKIDERTLKDFEATLHTHAAPRGLFITTSDYTEGALAFARSRQYLELISGTGLVQRLDEMFSPGRYVIRDHT